MWKGDKSISQQRTEELYSHKHVTSHVGIVISHLLNTQKHARESTVSYLYTNTHPFALYRHSAYTPMTKNVSNTSNWILIAYRRKKKLAQLKKYLSATLDNSLTLHKSAVLLATGDTDFGPTMYGGYF